MNPMSIWYNCKYGILNLIKWFPTIWKDRDWDYYFLYLILQKKLKGMEDFHRNHGNCVGNIKWANQMKECINLIEALIKDDYNIEEYTKHNKKWGNSLIIDDKTKKNTYRLERKNINTKEDKMQEKKEFEECMKKETIDREFDKIKLFKIIKNNIDAWWD